MRTIGLLKFLQDPTISPITPARNDKNDFYNCLNCNLVHPHLVFSSKTSNPKGSAYIQSNENLNFLVVKYFVTSSSMILYCLSICTPSMCTPSDNLVAVNNQLCPFRKLHWVSILCLSNRSNLWWQPNSHNQKEHCKDDHLPFSGKSALFRKFIQIQQLLRCVAPLDLRC